MADPCAGRGHVIKAGNANVLLFGAGALGSYLNNKGMGWAYFIAPALGVLSFNLPSFCSGNPPDLPVIDATRLAGYFSPLNPLGAAQLRSDMQALIGHFLWYDVCDCASPPLVTPPGPVAQPANYTLNPAALTPSPAAADCANNNQPSTPYFGTSSVQVVFGPGIATTPGAPTAVTLQIVTVGTVQNHTTFWDFYDVNNSHIANVGAQVLSAGGPGSSFTVACPLGTDKILFTQQWAGAEAGGARFTWVAQLWCNNTIPGQTLQPCCPPDPVVTQLLNEVLSTLYSSLPSQLTSYAEGTVHAGLTGAGTVTLTAATIAVKVTITADTTGKANGTGNPQYLFDRGFIVPIAVEGPIRGPARLAFNPQLFQLPALTEQIGYTLPVGLTISITELTVGP